MIEQGVRAIVAFNTLNGRINSRAKLEYFSGYKSSPYREIAKE
jgi:hypothetical protein